MSSYFAGMVGIIGLPNAGKSTFLNNVVKDKIAIVSPKPQTTRRRQLGIVNCTTGTAPGQIAFIDTPGLVPEEKGLFQYLHKEAKQVAEEADALLVMVSLDSPSKKDVFGLIEFVEATKKPWVMAISKVDLKEHFQRKLILENIAKEKNVPCFQLGLSDDDRNQSEEVLEALVKILPPSAAPLFDPEIMTTSTLRELAGEIVREKCLLLLRDEVPYGMATHVQKFDEADPKITKIAIDLWVAKPNHKAIVIGKKGETLKEIGTQARKDIEALLGNKVFLELHVLVKEMWQEKSHWMNDLGYKVQNEKR